MRIYSIDERYAKLIYLDSQCLCERGILDNFYYCARCELPYSLIKAVYNDDPEPFSTSSVINAIYPMKELVRYDEKDKVTYYVIYGDDGRSKVECLVHDDVSILDVPIYCYPIFDNFRNSYKQANDLAKQIESIVDGKILEKISEYVYSRIGKDYKKEREREAEEIKG